MADIIELKRRPSVDWSAILGSMANPIARGITAKSDMQSQLLPLLFKAQLERQQQAEQLQAFKEMVGKQGGLKPSYGPSGISLTPFSQAEQSAEEAATRSPRLGSVLAYIQKAAQRGAPSTVYGEATKQYSTPDEIKSIVGAYGAGVKQRPRQFAPKEPTLEEASFMSDAPAVMEDLRGLMEDLTPETKAPGGGFARVSTGQRWLLGKEETDLRKIQEKYIRARKTLLFGPAGKALTGTERSVVESALTPTGKSPEEWERDIKVAYDTLMRKEQIMNKKFKGRYKQKTTVTDELAEINQRLAELEGS